MTTTVDLLSSDMEVKVPRITWKDGHYGGSDGYAAGLQLFTIRPSGARGSRPVMWSPLLDQGELLDRPERGEPLLLKARAERILLDFVHKLGAVFPDEED